MGLVNTKTNGLGIRIGVAYTTPEKGGDIRILRKIHHVCACIWRREIYDSEKRVWLGATRVVGLIFLCNFF